MGGRSMLVAALVAALALAAMGWRLSVVSGELELTTAQLAQTRQDYAEDTQRWSEALDQKTKAVDALRAAGETGFKALDTANADCRAIVANVMKNRVKQVVKQDRAEVASDEALLDSIRWFNRHSAR